ncbi:MAG: type II toxin-antitoxin system YafQ family toxin [Epsilonproteobacteria bacterium]|nr:type II toxin-antitoxin system YafQ family toxin [Campylobacterota bacterium]
MLKIIRQKSFVKDLSKIKITDTQFAKYINYLSKLIHQEPLPIEARDHSLSGEWQDVREFHIGGDLLIIYILTDESLVLIRIGSHAGLFKKM